MKKFHLMQGAWHILFAKLEPDRTHIVQFKDVYYHKD